jgi:hypothetical protein
MLSPVSSELVVGRPARRLGTTAVLLAIVAGALLGIFACATETAHAGGSEHTSVGRHGGEHTDQAEQPGADPSESDQPGHSGHSDHSGHLDQSDSNRTEQPEHDRSSRHPDHAVTPHDGHANLSCAALIDLGIDAAPRLSVASRVGQSADPAPAQSLAPPDPPVPRRSMSF